MNDFMGLGKVISDYELGYPVNDRQKTIVLSERMAEKFLNVDERIDRVDRDVHVLYFAFMSMIVLFTTFILLTMCGCAGYSGYYGGGDYVPVHYTYDAPSTYNSGSALTTRSGNTEYTTFSNGGSAFTTHNGSSSYTTYSGF